MPPVVADTSPLVAFSGIERLDLLRMLFSEVLIPPAVLLELEAGDWKAAAGVLRVVRANGWIRVRPIDSLAFPATAPAKLGAGELEVLGMAQQLGVTALIDDRTAWIFAEKISIPVVRSLAILARAKRLRIISSVRPLVAGMVENGIRLSPNVVSHFIMAMGE